MKNKKLKIALFSDYFSGIPPYGGGGEVYAIRLAESLIQDFHKVTFFTNKLNDKKIDIYDVFKYYGVNDKICNQIMFKSAPTIGLFYKTRKPNEIKAFKFFKKQLQGFDCFINCSESTMHGFTKSLNLPSYKVVHFPVSLCSKNPYYPKYKKWFYKITYDAKLQDSYNLFLPNSDFTNFWVKKLWDVKNTKTLYPPIKFSQISNSELSNKKNYILYTGRVIKQKMCLEFAECFKKIYQKYPNWTFVIIGNYNPIDAEYVSKVEHALYGTSYQIHFDAPQDQLMQYYRNSKIFWSGKGYGTDDPSNMEHFGMTTVEAMANGCVPVVINKAGQAEIVKEELGFKWDNFKELIKQTEKLILDDEFMTKMSINSIDESRKYLVPEFMNNFYASISACVNC